MNLTSEQIVSIVSAVGISAIVSAIITFVQNNKKNNLDFVTKERSEWRKKLKEILSELSDGGDKNSAIIKLKSEINPYGKNMEFKNTKTYYMKDGHIWDLLDGKDDVDFDRLGFYIGLLLKFDWERSKSEVRFKPTKGVNRVMNFLLFFSSLYCIYLSSNFLSHKTNFPNEMNFIMSVVVFFLILLQPFVTDTTISNSSENQKKQFWLFIIFYTLPYIYITWNLIHKFNLGRSSWVISVMLIFVYEIFYLYLLSTYEDTYIREIKRSLRPKSKKYQLGVKLINQIRDREDKLNRYEYDTTTINSLNKRLKKLKRKSTKLRKPREYMLHPILFYRYRKNRKRIIREVKKLIRRN